MTESSSGESGSESGPGPDLARAALAAARAEARTRGADARRSGRARVRGPRATTARSGSGPDDRDPQLLGSALGRLVSERGWEQPVAVGGVIGRWADIVGAQTAEHVRAESIEEGVVTVVCDSTAWASEMRLLAPTLVRRLNEELGDNTVRRVTVIGPSAPSWRRGPLRVEGRGPRDTYG